MDTSADSIRVVGEADLLELAKAARSTWHHWCTKGLLSQSDDGLYGERDVIEVLVAGMLVAALDVRRATAAWGAAREPVLETCAALAIAGDDTLDAVVDLYTLEIAIGRTPQEIEAVTHRVGAFWRGYLVLPLALSTREARRGFRTRAVSPSDLAKDKRRRAGRKAR